MLTRSLGARIPGTPATKGSMKCVGGRGGRHQLVDSNAGTKAWMKRLTDAIPEVWPDDQRADAHQPLAIEAHFFFRRPVAHYRTGRYSADLSPSAPAYPSTRTVGDVDKLVRALLDALQAAGVLDDDAQVIKVTTSKAWVERDEDPGVGFRLMPLTAADPALVDA